MLQKQQSQCIKALVNTINRTLHKIERFLQAIQRNNFITRRCLATTYYTYHSKKEQNIHRREKSIKVQTRSTSIARHLRASGRQVSTIRISDVKRIC